MSLRNQFTATADSSTTAKINKACANVLSTLQRDILNVIEKNAQKRSIRSYFGHTRGKYDKNAGVLHYTIYKEKTPDIHTAQSAQMKDAVLSTLKNSDGYRKMHMFCARADLDVMIDFECRPYSHDGMLVSTSHYGFIISAKIKINTPFDQSPDAALLTADTTTHTTSTPQDLGPRIINAPRIPIQKRPVSSK